jgi:hypothetical protein
VSTTESGTDRSVIGWGRATLTGLAALVVGTVAAVGGANAVLTKATGLSRDLREYIASIVFLAVVIALAWVLRRLQARGLI